MSSELIKLALVDDEELMVQLLADFLSKEKNIEVVIKAFDGDDFLHKLRVEAEKPELVVMDLRMKNMDGLETTKIMKEEFPDIKIITLSSNYKKASMGYMLKAGVNAFLPKEVAPTTLVDVINQVYSKGFYFTEEQVDIMREQMSQSSPKPIKSDVETFSTRELEVLDLLCQQLTAAEIADKLCLNKRTVEGHKNNLLQKAGVKNTTGLIIYAIQKKLVDIDRYESD